MFYVSGRFGKSFSDDFMVSTSLSETDPEYFDKNFVI